MAEQFEEVTFDDFSKIYTSNDVHDSEWKTIIISKYGASKGSSGTPTVFLNGVKLDATVTPKSTAGWEAMLEDIYSR